MKKLALLSLLIACIALVFVSCTGDSKGGVDIVIDENNPSVVKDGSTLAPNSLVKFAWTDSNGNPVTCDYVLTKDGEVVEEQKGVTEITTIVTEEGHYVATFKPVNMAGSRGTKTVRFTVNKMYEELYKADSGLYQWADISDSCKKAYLEGEDAKIYFYKMGSETVENVNPENTNETIKLSLVDSDSDGMPDTWRKWVPGETRIPLTVSAFSTPYGTAVYKDIQYSDQDITVKTAFIVAGDYVGETLTFNNVIKLADVGLNLNTQYSTVIESESYNQYPYLSYFEDNLYLSERYDSDTKPEFSLIEETNSSENRDASITVNVTAPNVADFATLYNTKYMQVAVSYPASLTLDSVDFDNFVEGTKEFTSYKVIDSPDLEDKVVFLYRGLVSGNDEETAVTDFFATLNFEGSSGNGNGSIALDLIWNGNVAYGPMFMDNENKQVDGFSMDYEPLTVTW